MWPRRFPPDRAPKQAEKNEERFEHPDKGQPELHIYEDNHTGEWCVWLNSGIADHDGLCIGHGATRDAAVADAVGVIEWMEAMLQGPSPAKLREMTGAISEVLTQPLSQSQPLFTGWSPAPPEVPPCRPTKKYLRWWFTQWEEADRVEGPWSRVRVQ